MYMFRRRLYSTFPLPPPLPYAPTSIPFQRQVESLTEAVAGSAGRTEHEPATGDDNDDGGTWHLWTQMDSSLHPHVPSTTVIDLLKCQLQVFRSEHVDRIKQLIKVIAQQNRQLAPADVEPIINVVWKELDPKSRETIAEDLMGIVDGTDPSKLPPALRAAYIEIQWQSHTKHLSQDQGRQWIRQLVSSGFLDHTAVKLEWITSWTSSTRSTLESFHELYALGRPVQLDSALQIQLNEILMHRLTSPLEPHGQAAVEDDLIISLLSSPTIKVIWLQSLDQLSGRIEGMERLILSGPLWQATRELRDDGNSSSMDFVRAQQSLTARTEALNMALKPALQNDDLVHEALRTLAVSCLMYNYLTAARLECSSTPCPPGLDVDHKTVISVFELISTLHSTPHKLDAKTLEEDLVKTAWFISESLTPPGNDKTLQPVVPLLSVRTRKTVIKTLASLVATDVRLSKPINSWYLHLSRQMQAREREYKQWCVWVRKVADTIQPMASREETLVPLMLQMYLDEHLKDSDVSCSPLKIAIT